MKIERLEHCEKSKHFINIFGLKYKKNYKEKMELPIWRLQRYRVLGPVQFIFFILFI